MCFASHAASRRFAPCAAEWNSRLTLFSAVWGVSRSCEYSACSTRWKVKRMFVRRRRGESLSLRSSGESVVPRDGSELDCEGLIVANEEDDGWAEWFGVGGRDTGTRPLGVRSSFETSSQVSSEGRRGRLFIEGASLSQISASCEEIQTQRLEIQEKGQTTLSRWSATACHQCLISCLSSLFSNSSIAVIEAVAGGVFSSRPLLAN